MDGLPQYFKSVVGALLALAAATIGVITTLSLVHWSSSQTTLVSTAAAAAITFIAAIWAHFDPRTKREPVALAATFTALVSAILALGTGFAWWHLNAEQIAALVSLVTAFIGIFTALVARNNVVAGMPGNAQVLKTASAAAEATAAATAGAGAHPDAIATVTAAVEKSLTAI